MPAQLVTVFGGTGFLGRRIVRHLHDAGFAVRIASRHPDRGRSLFPGDNFRVESVHADVNGDTSVEAAVSGVFAVVNAVSPRDADTEGGNQPADKSLIDRRLKRSIPGSVQPPSSQSRPRCRGRAG